MAAIQYNPGSSIDYYGLITFIDGTTNNTLYLRTWDFSTGFAVTGSTPIDVGSSTNSNHMSNPRIDAFDDYTINNRSNSYAVFKIVAQIDSKNTGTTKVIRTYDNTQMGWPCSSYTDLTAVAGASVYSVVPVAHYNNYAPTVAVLSQTFPVAHMMEYDAGTPGSDIVFMEPVLSPVYNIFLLNDYYFVNSQPHPGIAPPAMDAYGTYASAVCAPANYGDPYDNMTLITWAQLDGSSYDIKYKYSGEPFAFRPAPGGVATVQAGKWQVYPNPATDELVVSASNSKATTAYAITDMGGRSLLQGSWQQQTGSIAVCTLPPGTYLLRLDGSGSTWQSLFVKK